MKIDKIISEMVCDFDNRFTPSTISTYVYAIKRFMEHYPNPKKVVLPDVENYLLNLKKNGSSIGYRKTTLASIKSFFTYLLDISYIKEHPCMTYHLKEKKPSGKDFSSFLTMEEMEMLLKLKLDRYKHTKNRNKAILGLHIYQGVTSKELVNMRLEDVDLDSGVVFIRGCGKNRSRSISLKSNQINTLYKYINEDRKHLLKSATKVLFISMRGVSMSVDGLHSLVSSLSGAFSKTVSPLIIRNSVISYWLNARKFPLEDVQVMSGHRYPSSTEKYIHPDIQEQREAMTNLHSEIFG